MVRTFKMLIGLLNEYSNITIIKSISKFIVKNIFTLILSKGISIIILHVHVCILHISQLGNKNIRKEFQIMF